MHYNLISIIDTIPKISPDIWIAFNFSLNKILPIIHTAITFITETKGNKTDAFSLPARYNKYKMYTTRAQEFRQIDLMLCIIKKCKAKRMEKFNKNLIEIFV